MFLSRGIFDASIAGFEPLASIGLSTCNLIPLTLIIIMIFIRKSTPFMFLYRNNRVKFFTIAPGQWTGPNEHMFDEEGSARLRLTVEVVTTHIWVEPALVDVVEVDFVEVLCGLFHSDGVFHYIEFT